MTRAAVGFVVVLATAGFAAAQRSAEGGLDELAGLWDLFDARGVRVGHSRIEVESPGTMLVETRQIDGSKPQTLWFAHLEHDGWAQWFAGPTGALRAFRTTSPAGAWPLVMGAEVTTQEGQRTRYRMTMSRSGADESRRVLESSRDSGATWTRVFDYLYRRTTPRQ